MEVKLYKPHPAQIDILTAPQRFKIVNCPRRFGKTTLGKIIVAEVMIKYREEVFWIAPNFATSTQVWEELKETFYPITEYKSEQQRILKIKGGGSLRVFSGEKYENIRGTSPFQVIVDEAATIPKLEDMWNAVIRPALSDKKGRAIFLSTPKGRNFFYELYKMGTENNSDYISFKKFSWENPFLPKSEILAAQNTLPEKLFAQEYLAEFLLDAGEVFVGVTHVAIGEYKDFYPGRFVFGIDLARKYDYTVCSVVDAELRQQVDMLRINKTSWDAIKKEIEKFYFKWRPYKITIEENNNESVIEDLKNRGLPARGYFTTNTKKNNIIQRLAVAIQNREITLLNDLNLINEFQAFQMNLTANGNMTYGAPNGFHDDIVMATAISFTGVYKGNSVQVLPLPKSIWSRK